MVSNIGAGIGMSFLFVVKGIFTVTIALTVTTMLAITCVLFYLQHKLCSGGHPHRMM